MKAIMIGATGAVGEDVLRHVLDDARFDAVHIFVRHDPKIKNDKLHTHVVDFDDIDSWKEDLQGDVLFSSMGTSLKKAGSKARQWHVDYDYQYQAARAAKANGVSRYVLVSSIYASPRSSIFYLRMKGELEEAIRNLHFDETTILQPPTLIRHRPMPLVIKLNIKAVSLLNRFGLFKNNKPMPTDIVAKAMIEAAFTETKGYHIWNSRRIWQEAKNFDRDIPQP